MGHNSLLFKKMSHMVNRLYLIYPGPMTQSSQMLSVEIIQTQLFDLLNVRVNFGSQFVSVYSAVSWRLLRNLSVC